MAACAARHTRLRSQPEECIASGKMQYHYRMKQPGTNMNRAALHAVEDATVQPGKITKRGHTLLAQPFFEGTGAGAAHKYLVIGSAMQGDAQAAIEMRGDLPDHIERCNISTVEAEEYCGV